MNANLNSVGLVTIRKSLHFAYLCVETGFSMETKNARTSTLEATTDAIFARLNLGGNARWI